MGTSRIEDTLVSDLTHVARQNYAQIANEYHRCTNGKRVFLTLMYNMIEQVEKLAKGLEPKGMKETEIDFLTDSSRKVLGLVSDSVSKERVAKYTILLAENRYNLGFKDGEHRTLEGCPLQFPEVQKCDNGQSKGDCRNYTSVVLIGNMLETIQDEVPKGCKTRYNTILKKYREQRDKCGSCASFPYQECLKRIIT